MLAQAALPACPSNRPVDDFIAEIHKAQSKKKARNKNPLPDFACVFGWCKSTKNPSAGDEPGSRAPANSGDGASTSSSNGESSSSKPASVACDEAMQRSLDAAHDVDVGDTYLEEKNFRAALYRYQDADKLKPDDAAIEVRLGRAYEKLGQSHEAVQQYVAATKLPGPEKWTQEARESLGRLSKSR